MTKKKTKARILSDAIASIVCAAILLSIVPVFVLYLKPNVPYYTNAQAIDKLKDNKGDYFEFIVFGDNHAGLIFNDSTALKEIRHMNREDRFMKVPVDFALSTGDITFRGSEWDYMQYNKLRALLKMPVISAIGNHDDDNGGGKRFEKYVGTTEFAFTNRNCYFIVLDNSVNNMTEEQFDWLERNMERSLSYRHRFVALHKAPFAPYQQSWYRPELSEWSYRFMKLCEKYRVDIVFSGHEHMTSIAKFGGVRYIISGGGGMLPHQPGSEGGYPHYMVVKVRGDYISHEVRKIFPPLWEFLTYYMWKEIFYFIVGVIY